MNAYTPSTAYLLFELIPDNISPMGIMAINANNMIKTLVLVVISLTIWLSMPRVRIDKFVNFGWRNSEEGRTCYRISSQKR